MSKTPGFALIAASLLAATLYYLTQSEELPSPPELPSAPGLSNTTSHDEFRRRMDQRERTVTAHLDESDEIVARNHKVFLVTLTIALGGALLGGALLLFKPANRGSPPRL